MGDNYVESESLSTMNARLGIVDGLRGIAVMQVVWFHLWVMQHVGAPFAWLDFIPKTGNFGLFLFFFVSGFVIVYPFLRDEALGTPIPRWGHFAWRRFVKIIPSYVLTIAVAYVTGFAVVERGHATVAQELITHALFIYSWWPGLDSTVNGVLWTLAIEVQFYVLFPLIWRCFRTSPWPTGLGLIAFALALRIWRSELFPPDAVNVLSANLPNFIDLFAFGMLSAWCYVHLGPKIDRPIRRYGTSLLALVGSATIVVTAATLASDHPWLPSNPLHEVLGFGFAALTVGALASAQPWTILLSNPLLRFLATISYNLYLYNWMITYGVGHLTGAAFVIAAVGLSIAAGALVTFALERPLLRLPDPAWFRRPTEM